MIPKASLFARDGWLIEISQASRFARGGWFTIVPKASRFARSDLWTRSLKPFTLLEVIGLQDPLSLSLRSRWSVDRNPLGLSLRLKLLIDQDPLRPLPSLEVIG